MPLTTEQLESMHRMLKVQLGYSEDTCKGCTHFTPCDQSGNPRALPAHCSYNPSIAMPVSEHGHCSNFTKREIGE
jgi:hypothetical protein